MQEGWCFRFPGICHVVSLQQGTRMSTSDGSTERTVATSPLQPMEVVVFKMTVSPLRSGRLLAERMSCSWRAGLCAFLVGLSLRRRARLALLCFVLRAKSSASCSRSRASSCCTMEAISSFVMKDGKEKLVAKA